MVVEVVCRTKTSDTVHARGVDMDAGDRSDCIRRDPQSAGIRVAFAMKPPAKPLSPAVVRMAIAINQFATPGLGSLLGRRWIAGAGQLCLSVIGFTFFLVWFVKIMIQFYGTVQGNVEVKPVGWIAWTGLVVFAISWLWALVTSVSLWRELSRQQEAAAFAQTK